MRRLSCQPKLTALEERPHHQSPCHMRLGLYLEANDVVQPQSVVIRFPIRSLRSFGVGLRPFMLPNFTATLHPLRSL